MTTSAVVTISVDNRILSVNLNSGLLITGPRLLFNSMPRQKPLLTDQMTNACSSFKSVYK